MRHDRPWWSLRVPAAGLLLLVTAFSFAQQAGRSSDILLRQGVLRTAENVHDAGAPVRGEAQELFRGRYYRLLQFDHVLTQAERASLAGVDLLEYLPHRAYIASIDAGVDLSTLASRGLHWVGVYEPGLKLHPQLAQRPFPEHAVLGSRLHLMVRLHRDVPFEAGSLEVLKQGAEVLNTFPHAGLLEVVVTEDRLPVLAALSAVALVEPGPPPGEPEDLLGQSLHRSNGLNTSYAGGLRYDGTGVSIAVNDDGFVGPHIDFQGRTEQSDVAGDFTGDHGDMVAGIAGGAGNIDPSIQGMAPGAFLWIRQYSGSLPNTVTLHQNNGVMVFNSSYSNGCNAGYTAVTQLADQEIIANPTLIQTFSAGNSNGSDCGYGAGNQWGNITGGHKIGKNVIAAANLLSDETLVGSSSRGPASDGRIKPDIASNGNGQLSTDPNNTYGVGGGTSAAAPGIMGVMAQLMHAHRDLNGGTDAPSGLLKACLLNTAHDLGNTGPDFKYGWGRVNVTRAYGILADGRYLNGTVGQGGSDQHTISVPAGVDELRVMVYWMDPAGSTLAAKALVNDLDMTLTDPGNTTTLPWVLDPTPDPALLDLPATNGVDTLNNVEQVALLNPAAGTYTVTVNGSEVPQGPQQYFVVWEFFSGLTLTYPIGGEGLTPGSTERIHWDATGTSGNFTLEYSTDGGGTWNAIATVGGGARMHDWTVPNTVSGQVRVRVSRGGASDQSHADLSIVEEAQNLFVVRVCPTEMRVSWDPVPGATEYTVHLLGAQYMDSIGTTAALFYDIPITDPNAEQWFSVTARGPSGLRSRRAVAVNYPGGGLLNCSVADDASANGISSPGGVVVGCFSLDVPVTIEVFNPGLSDQTSFPVSYRLNNGAVVTETYPGPLLSGATDSYTFTQLLTLPGNGTYDLAVWTSLPGDGAAFNDTAYTTITVLNGTAVSLPVSEDFESFSSCSTASDCGTTVCALGNGWVNLANGSEDDVDWRVDNGGTPSVDTGPSVDHAPGTSGGNYIYLETSGTCAAQEGVLLSPCVDLSGAVAPSLVYWYHLYGASMGELHLDLYDGTQWNDDIVPAVIGDQGDQWLQQVVDLTPWAGQTVVLRFRGITGSSWTSDMALDDINVYDAAAPPAVAFTATPETGCLGDTITLSDASLNLPTSWSWDIQPAGSYVYIAGTSNTSQQPLVVFTSPGLYTVSLTATNGFGSNTLTQNDLIDQAEGTTLAMALVTDRYGAETTWQVVYNGSVLASGGPYVNTGTNGEFPQDTVFFCAPQGVCPDLIVNDSFGDGMCCAYGNGNYQLLTLNGDTLVNGDGQFATQQVDNFCVPAALRLGLKVFLEGPFNTGAQQMDDDLRAEGLLPVQEPYAALGFPQAGGQDASTFAGVFATTGADAIVDWVRVELRDANDPAIIVAAASGLLQRDGDVVDVDGVSAFGVVALPGNYHVAVRHRNHLGVMTASPMSLSSTPTAIDLTNASIPTWGTGALKLVNGTWMLWAGNVVDDGYVKYVGDFNDRDPLLLDIGGAIPTNTVDGYFSSDVNMDGTVQYTGSGNDRDLILNNVGSAIPTNTRDEQLP